MHRHTHTDTYFKYRTVQSSAKKFASISFDPENSPSGIFPLEITADIPRDFVNVDVYQATT